MNIVQRTSIGIVAMMLGASIAAADALPRQWSPRVSLDLVVNGNRLPQTPAVGGRRVTAPGWGTQYDIYVRNQTGPRVLAVVSVDGLSVMDGRPQAG